MNIRRHWCKWVGVLAASTVVTLVLVTLYTSSPSVMSRALNADHSLATTLCHGTGQDEQPLQSDVIPNLRSDVSPNLPSDVSPNLRCMDPEGKGYIQDFLCIDRPRYLASYKNPCWLDWMRKPAQVRCLPYFHVLGVDKCGTTDLHARLLLHPHVLRNQGELGKEVMFWSWYKNGLRFKQTNPPSTFHDYVMSFDSAASTIVNHVKRDGTHHYITGDGTPMDFYDFRSWPMLPQNRKLSEPAVLTPHLMKHLYVNPKFIIIMRNPTERLYSDYYFLKYGTSPETFSRHVSQALDMMNRCLKFNSTRLCAFSQRLYVDLPCRIQIGMYSVYMKEWLAVFPRSSFYILRTEDFSHRMADHLKNIFKFLDLEPLEEKQMASIVNESRHHVTKLKSKTRPMHATTRNLLDEFYRPYNQELASLLDDQGYLWQ